MTAPEELDGFVRREHPRLVAALTLLLDDRAVAEEVTQEALLRAASRWEHVGGLESPGGWVHRVAVNLATSQLRRRRLERRARSRIAVADRVEAVDTATSVSVRRALAELPERDRRLLVLHHVLGWSAPELADREGGTPDAVRQRLVRARAALRAVLGDEDVDVDLVAPPTPRVVTTPPDGRARAGARAAVPREERSDAR